MICGANDKLNCAMGTRDSELLAAVIGFSTVFVLRSRSGIFVTLSRLLIYEGRTGIFESSIAADL